MKRPAGGAMPPLKHHVTVFYAKKDGKWWASPRGRPWPYRRPGLRQSEANSIALFPSRQEPVRARDELIRRGKQLIWSGEELLRSSEVLIPSKRSSSAAVKLGSPPAPPLPPGRSGRRRAERPARRHRSYPRRRGVN
jgi:hypothetical protein